LLFAELYLRLISRYINLQRNDQPAYDEFKNITLTIKYKENVMSKKKNTVWICQSCGAKAFKWAGYCSSCGEWNTIVEEVIRSEDSPRGISAPAGTDVRPVAVGHVSFTEAPRFSSGSAELDRVLGGGIVPGSFVLVGGDPGIGKSTLLTQLAGRVAESKGPVLYVSAEESLSRSGSEQSV